MENDVLDALSVIGYNGPLADSAALKTSLKAGLKDILFRQLIIELCQQLKSLLSLDESIHDTADNDDTSGFVMELSSLLKELSCPYKNFLEGPVTDRFANEDQLLRLLYFLVTEIMSARLANSSKISSNLSIRASDPAKDLKSVLVTLKFPRPPDNVTPLDLFSKVELKLNELKAKVPPALIGKPLMNGILSPEQWNDLNGVYSELQQEYKLRREMLLKRLDVTVQSFEWSEAAKGKNDAIAAQFIEKRNSLQPEPGVQLADVLAAREDLAVIEKTSSSAARKNTQSSVHKVIIGRVPDRGGRPNEQAAPPPEMPSWQKERAQGGGGGRGQFSRGGGRVQGGWNQHDDRGDSHKRYDNRGDFDDRRGRGGRGRGGRGRNNY